MTPNSRFTTEFWDGLTENHLRVPECTDCTTRFFPPGPLCPNCGSTNVTWASITPDGTLYSFTQVHRAPPGFDTPRVLGQLDLNNGPRMFGLINANFADLSIGDPARIEPFDYTDTYDRGALADYPYYHIVPTH